MVRHYMDDDIPNKEAYVMVGTQGKKLVMNEDNSEKNPVVLERVLHVLAVLLRIFFTSRTIVSEQNLTYYLKGY